MKEKEPDDFEHFEQLLASLKPKQGRFLRIFRVLGDVAPAAEKAKVSRGSHYYWMATSVAYRQAFELCTPQVCDHIEDPLVNRLANGWLEPVYQGGELVGHRRKFDNMAAIRYLERRSPKFKPSSEVDISGAVPIQFYLPDNGRNPEKE